MGLFQTTLLQSSPGVFIIKANSACNLITSLSCISTLRCCLSTVVTHTQAGAQCVCCLLERLCGPECPPPSLTRSDCCLHPSPAISRSCLTGHWSDLLNQSCFGINGSVATVWYRWINAAKVRCLQWACSDVVFADSAFVKLLAPCWVSTHINTFRCCSGLSSAGATSDI